jgi:hypothetical protein
LAVSRILAGPAALIARALNPTEKSIMARKPNYPFERMERERQKAAKKAEKARLKAEARARGEPDPVDTDDAEDAADEE